MHRLGPIVLAMLLACGGRDPSASAASEPAPPPVAAPSTDPAPEPPPVVEPPPAPVASALDGDLEWRLTASATTLSMAERADWRLRTEATNRGDAPVDFFESGFASFTVNGEPSMALSLAFGNGLAPAEWASLAPGATAAPERALGESLFESPGDYEIVMTHGMALVGLVVHVTP